MTVRALAQAMVLRRGCQSNLTPHPLFSWLSACLHVVSDGPTCTPGTASPSSSTSLDEKPEQSTISLARTVLPSSQRNDEPCSYHT